MDVIQPKDTREGQESFLHKVMPQLSFKVEKFAKQREGENRKRKKRFQIENLA